MSQDKIRIFAISKLGWIKQQQRKLREQERETPREYLNLESHYLWGKRYLLRVIDTISHLQSRFSIAGCCFGYTQRRLRRRSRRSWLNGIGSVEAVVPQ